MSGFPEAIRKSFEKGGAVALLVDLYLEDETLRLTNWDQPIRYGDPVNGTALWYAPTPFVISDETPLTRDTQETGILTVQFGLLGYDSENESESTTDSPYTSTQLDQFSELMADLDAYFEQHDVRGSLAIFRLVNPHDLSADARLFTGLIDQLSLGDTGIIFEVAEAKDVLNAPAYPVSTMCCFRFGDHRCRINADASSNFYQGTAQSGSTLIVTDSSITPATDDYWSVGILKMTSGKNKGVSRVVKGYDNATSTVTLTVSLPSPISAGDTFDLRRSCKKTGDYCRDTFANLTRFGGYLYANNPVQGLYWRGKG